MAMYYNGKKVRNLYYNGECITRLALGKEMTRLVEGDDFVRAQWLCGRNGAYIDTNYNIKAGIDTFDVHFKYDGTTWNPEGLEQNIFGCIDNDNYLVRTYINHLNFIAAHYFKLQKTYPYFEQATDADIQFLRIEDAEHFAYSFNGNEHIVPYTWMGNKTLTSTCYLFNVNHQPYGGNIGRYFHGDIAYFSIEPNKIRMFPCRLLQPIPATLDGNGIARNAGECGMFDAVSGKFYGNVANNGNFTVSDN